MEELGLPLRVGSPADSEVGPSRMLMDLTGNRLKKIKYQLNQRKSRLEKEERLVRAGRSSGGSYSMIVLVVEINIPLPRSPYHHGSLMLAIMLRVLQHAVFEPLPVNILFPKTCR